MGWLPFLCLNYRIYHEKNRFLVMFVGFIVRYLLEDIILITHATTNFEISKRILPSCHHTIVDTDTTQSLDVIQTT